LAGLHLWSIFLAIWIWWRRTARAFCSFAIFKLIPSEMSSPAPPDKTFQTPDVSLYIIMSGVSRLRCINNWRLGKADTIETYGASSTVFVASNFIVSRGREYYRGDHCQRSCVELRAKVKIDREWNFDLGQLWREGRNSP
jgi:hypothetical protein